MKRILLKPIHLSSEATSSIHENVSKGYYQVTPSGTKIFIPYNKVEMGEIHSFISPGIDTYKNMKWTKTHEWKDQKKAKSSKWYYHSTFGGLNTVPR